MSVLSASIRAMRDTDAAAETDRAITGIRYEAGPVRPATGNACSVMAKTMTRSTPRRYSGMAAMNAVTPVKAVSAPRRRLPG